METLSVATFGKTSESQVCVLIVSIQCNLGALLLFDLLMVESCLEYHLINKANLLRRFYQNQLISHKKL